MYSSRNVTTSMTIALNHPFPFRNRLLQKKGPGKPPSFRGTTDENNFTDTQESSDCRCSAQAWPAAVWAG
jgi:hypothetical protein